MPECGIENGSTEAAWNCGYMLSNVHIATGDARQWVESMRKLQAIRPDQMPKGSNFATLALPGEFKLTVAPGKVALPAKLGMSYSKAAPVQTVEVKIDGVSVDALVDTGWIDTLVVSRDLARRLKLRELSPFIAGSRIYDPVSKVLIPELKFGSLVATNILASVVEAKGDQALIGLRLLERFGRVTFQPGKITFENEVAVAPDCKVAAPLRFVSDPLLRTEYHFDIHVGNAGKIPAILDTGAGYSLVVDHSAVNGKIALPPLQRIMGSQWGNPATTAMGSKFKSTVEIGGATLNVDPIMAVPRDGSAKGLYRGLLGMALLPRNDVVMDFAGMRVCINPRN